MEAGGITRKQFVGILGGVAASAALGSFLLRSTPPALAAAADSAAAPLPSKGNIRIRPLPDRPYSPAFLAFCERTRFESVNHALRSVRDPRIEFAIEAVNAQPQFGI